MSYHTDHSQDDSEVPAYHWGDPVEEYVYEHSTVMIDYARHWLRATEGHTFNGRAIFPTIFNLALKLGRLRRPPEDAWLPTIQGIILGIRSEQHAAESARQEVREQRP